MSSFAPFNDLLQLKYNERMTLYTLENVSVNTFLHACCFDKNIVQGLKITWSPLPEIRHYIVIPPENTKYSTCFKHFKHKYGVMDSVPDAIYLYSGHFPIHWDMVVLKKWGSHSENFVFCSYFP